MYFFSYFRSVAATGNSNKKVKISATDKNPVMLLNELRPGLKYEVDECGEYDEVLFKRVWCYVRMLPYPYPIKV